MTRNQIIKDLLSHNQIYGFAFGGTKTLLYSLREIDCCYLVFGETSIDKYLEFLLHDNPPYILGLGSYSGIDQEKIRIETVCTNKFRNGFIDLTLYKEAKIPCFLKENQYLKESKAIGNSWCNFISWKIVNLIRRKKINSKYTFLHIPKSMKYWIAQKQIDETLRIFKNNY